MTPKKKSVPPPRGKVMFWGWGGKIVTRAMMAELGVHALRCQPLMALSQDKLAAGQRWKYDLTPDEWAPLGRYGLCLPGHPPTTTIARQDDATLPAANLRRIAEDLRPYDRGLQYGLSRDQVDALLRGESLEIADEPGILGSDEDES